MPRFACGPASLGSRWATTSSARSASWKRPAASAVSACWYSARDSGLATGSSGAGLGAGGSAFTGLGACAGASAGASISDSQPASDRHTARAASGTMRLVQRTDHPLVLLDLGVAHRPQLAERGVASLDPVVVDAAPHPPDVDLVQLDRLFLEGIGLLLEHHVVLLQLVLGQSLGALGVEQRLAEIGVQLGGPVGGRGRRFRYSVVRGDRIGLERLLQPVLLAFEILLQRLDE